MEPTQSHHMPSGPNRDFPTRNQLSKKTKPNNKLSLILLIVVLTGGLYYWRIEKQPTSSNINVENQAEEVIRQYQSQLPDLKNKAESNTSSDLQNYGVALYATRNLDKAEEVYKKQVTVDPDNSVAHNNLGNTLRDLKKFDGSVQEYEEAIRLAPHTISAYANLGSVYQYQQASIDKAIDVYKRGIEANPESVDMYILLALAYEQKQDNTNALKTYDQILKLQSDNQAAKAGIQRLNQ